MPVAKGWAGGGCSLAQTIERHRADVNGGGGGAPSFRIGCRLWPTAPSRGPLGGGGEGGCSRAKPIPRARVQGRGMTPPEGVGPWRGRGGGGRYPLPLSNAHPPPHCLWMVCRWVGGGGYPLHPLGTGAQGSPVFVMRPCTLHRKVMVCLPPAPSLSALADGGGSAAGGASRHVPFHFP